MSRPDDRPDQKPLIALVDRANRAMQTDMVRQARLRGHTFATNAHNAVFGQLPPEGARAVDMAARAGITRQSMGEVVRDLTERGIVETRPDPADGRAKLVVWTPYGRDVAAAGYRYIVEFERRLADEFGEEAYATARRVLARVTEILEEEAGGRDAVQRAAVQR